MLDKRGSQTVSDKHHRACNVTWGAGNPLGECEETIVLQQLWPWLDWSQSIEPQHCMLCIMSHREHAVGKLHYEDCEQGQHH